MENRQNIGKLFNDKLNNLDKEPGDAVWQSISEDLDKKKKRRILYFFFASMAAAALIGLGFYFSINGLDSVKSNMTPKSSIKNSVNHIAMPVDSSSTATTVDTINSQTQSYTQTDTVFKNKKTSRTKASVTKKLIRSTADTDEYEVVTRYKIYVKKTGRKTVTTKTTTVKNTVKGTKTKKVIAKKKIGKTAATVSKAKILTKKPYAKKVFQSKAKKAEPSEKENSQSTADKPEHVTQLDTTAIETTFETKAIDSCIIAIPTSDTVNKKKKREYKKSTIVPEKEKTMKIYLTAFAGPTYYNSISKGSSLLKAGTESTTKGNINYSFGVYGRVMFGEQFGLRIGLGKTTLGYTTRTPNPDKIGNLYVNSSLYNGYFEEYFKDSGKIELTQKLEYFELPVEAYYILQAGKKIGIDIFGGFSTYVLLNDSVKAESANRESISIGKSSNVSEAPFALNLGTVFNYKLNPNLQVDLSPVAQYQIGSFKQDTGFRPFVFSIQTGLTYTIGK